MEIRPYTDVDESNVIQLWRDCRLTVPHNDPVKDIQRKLAVQPELFLVGVWREKIIATVMAFIPGHAAGDHAAADRADHKPFPVHH